MIIGTADWTWGITGQGNPAPMNSMMQGSDGLNKIRVLNAGSALWVAASYNPSYPVEVYRPASSDYAQIKFSDNSWSTSGWFPTNLLASFTAAGTIEAWDYLDSNNTHMTPRRWAGAYTRFKNLRFGAANYSVIGTPYLEKAPGTYDLSGSFFLNENNLLSSATTFGWVNQQFIDLSIQQVQPLRNVNV